MRLYICIHSIGAGQDLAEKVGKIDFVAMNIVAYQSSRYCPALRFKIRGQDV